jgi:tetratricopeptide (TPR) repeat protein/predicted Ser/Thr protein kinase
METARARAEKALFGAAAPAKLGRYVLLDHKADGGMGVVYAAYDPELHRKAALKVLHPRRQWDHRAHERLIAEARALAKLDHPNVVKVHDVITQDDQVVIVMEWIEGSTLAVWERERARSWRDVVGVYSQAGQGLAAAHGVGVVHRDFKPSNAIIGADGRVRVLDFGLARLAEPGAVSASQHGEEPEPSSSSEDVEATSLTATGDVVGTLAYAAPEQITGDTATPGSDQFSFGISLHRALEGVAPFVGGDPEALVKSIRSGRIATAAEARALPKWLRAIVSRTLAAEPQARFPSMAELLAELARPRGWRRWRTPLVVSGCAAIAALALVTRPGASDPLADCDRGAAEAGTVWDMVGHARVGAALGIVTSPDASTIRKQILRGLDDYRDHWVASHRDACIAHRRGDQSDTLFDRRILCMQKRLGDLRAAVGVLEQLDAASANNAIDVVARMPSVAECADAQSLQADTAPPSDPAQRKAVESVRTHISQAMALHRAGHSSEALTAASTAIEEAERSGYPPVIADAALTHGRIQLARAQTGEAIPSLRRARDVALRQRQLAVAVEAAARELYAEGMVNPDVISARRQAEIFIPLSEGLSGDHFAGPLLLSNIGNVYMAAGNRAEATRYFQKAHAALAGIAAPDLELTCIDSNLAMVTADADTRESLARGVWERLRRELGESHLETLDALYRLGRLVTEPAKALPLLAQACTSYETFHPELTWPRILCESNRAFLAGELGDHAEELRLYEEIISVAAGSTDADVVARATLAAGYARLQKGDAIGAVATLQQVVNANARSPRWFERALAAHAELGVGLAERSLGHREDSAGHLKRALAIYSDIITLNEWAEYPRRMALAQRTLASLK